MARAVTDEQIVVAQAGRDSIIKRMNEVHADGDVVVCLPTTIAPAPPVGATGLGTT